MILRKFYDAAAEAPAATETVVETKTETPIAPVTSIAEAMAKFGRKDSREELVEVPLPISEKKEETKTTETEPPAATAKEEVKVEKVETETPKPTEQKQEAPKPQTEVKPIVEKSWQEVLKTQQPKAVLQALGFDEKTVDLMDKLKEFDPKILGLLDAYKSGDVTGYLKELSTDYSKMPAEEVMRHQLRREYPTASDKAIEALYEDEIVEKYNLDSEDADVLERGKLLLDARADKFRNELIKNQENFLLPKHTEKPKEEIVDPQAEAQRQQIESITQQLKEDKYTRSIVDSKKISIGEDGFTFPVDADSLLDLAINGDTTGELMFNKAIGANGEEVFTPKVEHQLLVAAVNKYGVDFLNEYAKHYKSLGSKKLNEQIENAKPPANNTSSSAEAEPKTPAEAMAKRGVLNSGGVGY